MKHRCRATFRCGYCSANRLHSSLRRLLSCDQQIAELNDPPVEIKSLKATRPWAIPSGVNRAEALFNLKMLEGNCFKESAIEEPLDRWQVGPGFGPFGKRVGRQGKKRQ